jgi:hypothetical protein
MKKTPAKASKKASGRPSGRKAARHDPKPRPAGKRGPTAKTTPREKSGKVRLFATKAEAHDYGAKHYGGPGHVCVKESQGGWKAYKRL